MSKKKQSFFKDMFDINPVSQKLWTLLKCIVFLSVNFEWVYRYYYGEASRWQLEISSMAREVRPVEAFEINKQSSKYTNVYFS